MTNAAPQRDRIGRCSGAVLVSGQHECPAALRARGAHVVTAFLRARGSLPPVRTTLSLRMLPWTRMRRRMTHRALLGRSRTPVGAGVDSVFETGIALNGSTLLLLRWSLVSLGAGCSRIGSILYTLTADELPTGPPPSRNGFPAMNIRHSLSVVAVTALLISGAATTAQAANGDSDHDGIPNRFERTHGMNPNRAADAKADFDKDGLNNLREYQVGSALRDEDTDNDGDDDADEVRDGFASTDVDDADTDNDGTLDGDEDADHDGIDNEDADDATETCVADDDDRDSDNIADEDENDFGFKVADSDSDNDGVEDGNEDADHDGVNDEDADDSASDDCDEDADHDGVDDEDADEDADEDEKSLLS